jgi:hypothetical protein
MIAVGARPGPPGPVPPTAVSGRSGRADRRQGAIDAVAVLVPGLDVEVNGELALEHGDELLLCVGPGRPVRRWAVAEAGRRNSRSR